MDQWLINHPGIPVNIYNIAEIVGNSFHQAFTPSNILKSFQRTGITPYNPTVFDDSDFLSSYVSDRPINSEADDSLNSVQASQQSSVNKENEENSTINQPQPSTSKFVSPELVRPHLKAKERNEIRKGRKKKTSIILTETPNMEERKNEQTMKRMKKDTKTEKDKVEKVKRRVLDSSSSDSDVDSELCNDLSDISFEEDEEETKSNNGDELVIADFVIVIYRLKKSVKHFVGQIDKIENENYHVNFLKRGDTTFFFSPDKKDEDICKKEDIVLRLPKPSLQGGTERAIAKLIFDFDFSNFYV